MRIAPLLVLAAALLSHGAGAQQADPWQRFGDSLGGHKSWVNTARIMRDNYGLHTYTAWWRVKPAAPNSVEGRPYSTHLSLFRVSCDRRSLTTLQLYYYDDAGKMVASDVRPGVETQAIPDSMGDAFVDEVCRLAKEIGK